MTVRLCIILMMLIFDVVLIGYAIYNRPISLTARRLTYSDIECQPPNTILIKPGTFDGGANLDDLMKHCGFAVPDMEYRTITGVN